MRGVYVKYILVVVAGYKNPLDACTGFEWDEANAHKNWERHRVTPEEAEDVFFNEPLVVRNRRDVPYQSLLKVFLAERLTKERRRA